MSNKRMNFLKQLCKDFDIDILYVFGNGAREVRNWVAERMGEIFPNSLNVDIGVRPLTKRHFGLKKRVFLTIALENFLGVNKVNLVVIPEVDLFLAANIIHGERLFFRNEYEADEYELYVLRRAGKLLPFKEERHEFIFGKN
jgi:hypothetical protein